MLLSPAAVVGDFGWLNWTVLGGYLLAILLMGVYFSRRGDGPPSQRAPRSIHSTIVLRSGNGMRADESGGIGFIGWLAHWPSHGRDVFRPNRCQTKGLVRARPMWT